MALATRLRALDEHVLGRPDAERQVLAPRPASGTWAWTVHLRDDVAAWPAVARGRFALTVMLLGAATAVMLAWAVPWSLVPLAAFVGAFVSRRFRDSLRWLCVLGALLNVFAWAYVVDLLPSSALLLLAAAAAPGVHPFRADDH